MIQTVKFDDLDAFAKWWVAGRYMAPPIDGYSENGRTRGVVLYRSGGYQVQMFFSEPGFDIPDHIHPNVDSYELYFCGDLYFRHSGQVLIEPGTVEPDENGIANKFGSMIRVRPDDSHGALTGLRGGVFISIQKWLNGVTPRFIELDWAGEYLDDAHKEVSKAGAI